MTPRQITDLLLLWAGNVVQLAAVVTLLVSAAIRDSHVADANIRTAAWVDVASQWEVAYTKWHGAAEQWRAGALSCFAQVRQYRALFDQTSTMMPAGPGAATFHRPLEMIEAPKP